MPQPKKNTKQKQIVSTNPVPPDAVRVWRGFRSGTLMPPQFLQALGSIFIPVTAQLQSLYGLAAYLPTVLPTQKPQGVPDEIALVFYQSQQAYLDTSLIVAGRAYSSLHQTVFAFPASQSGFPVLLGSAAALDQPYYLLSGAVDWQTGFAQVYVGARPSAVTSQQFASQLQRFFQDQQNHPPSGLDGAIFCISSDWVLYWEHWESEAESLQGHISHLPKLSTRVLLQPHMVQQVNSSLTAHYPGLSNVESKSFNILF